MKEYNEQVVETLDDAGCIIANKNIIIDNLQARIAELEEENAHIKQSRENFAVHAEQTLQQLAAEQLNNKRLREALEAVIKVHGYESGIPVEAISTQASTEALDKYVAEKVKEAGKFDMWKTNPYTKVLETSIEQLTKQRDLAVEALENCRLLAARHRKEEWAGHIMRFCKDAGLSGSPIRNDSIKESENNKAS